MWLRVQAMYVWLSSLPKPRGKSVRLTRVEFPPVLLAWGQTACVWTNSQAATKLPHQGGQGNVEQLGATPRILRAPSWPTHASQPCLPALTSRPAPRSVSSPGRPGRLLTSLPLAPCWAPVLAWRGLWHALSRPTKPLEAVPVRQAPQGPPLGFPIQTGVVYPLMPSGPSLSKGVPSSPPLLPASALGWAQPLPLSATVCSKFQHYLGPYIS